VIDRIVSRIGRRIDESTPLVDARLPDGSRVNAIIPPAALDGPILSIRRFRRRALSIENLLALESISSEMAEFLTGAIHARLNMIVTGGTGSGKTTLLNILSRYISNHERIVTIEDSAELMLQQPHVVRLETRPSNIEGRGQITQRDLVKNALRMRPDRILVGEVRGDEVLDMLQAMNTGHDGSLTTIHSNGPRDALHRLENLVLMSGHALPDKAIREQVVSAVNLVVHVSRIADGSRKVLSIQEIVGMEGAVISMQEIFRFVATGFDETNRIAGVFETTGIVPRCLDRMRLAGIEMPSRLFEQVRRPGGAR
jgi:pilus assembly protein CpaF